MNIYEVLDLIKEIIDKCPQVSGADFVLMMPKMARSIAKGYEIHIDKPFDEKTLACINNIIEKHNLTSRQEPNSILIYKKRNQKEP